MRKQITNKGRKWEMMNSFWMLWTFFPFGFFNYISFFYASYRVKQRKWFIAGVLYSIPFILFWIVDEIVDENHWLNDLSFIALFFSWVVSIIHVFNMRAEYLLRLEARSLSKASELEQLKTLIKEEYKVDTLMNETAKNAEHVNRDMEEPVTDRLVDINTATEEEIASIPAIGGLLAKKVVAVREKEGGFQSLEHFSNCLQLKPHVIEKIKPFIKFPEAEVPPKQNKHEGRVVDF
ncbi:DNA uptake protein ComE-like DNA-binding protein [Anoxybacillus tepidamans]|uniref:DNA uptake protein ComE-like DNA-binding protein n=1 Tax=Anoxybacteroides tepidamans TaxID=265948 RepID=A0A7W8IST3_9BACL|nr:helix-hairpin-helix domain-containing protein [Anoxybacillus tepidamans]MBB5326043.1 DNA uptake protein ComE-like DNA-binding protein [Anoxybacillus tepidamans]